MAALWPARKTGAAAAVLVVADDVDADMIVVGQRRLCGFEGCSWAARRTKSHTTLGGPS